MTPVSAATDAERLSRVALNGLVEPGDTRIGALVAEIGAGALHRLLVDERGPDGVRTDVAARLCEVDPDRELERADRLGLRFVIPGDDEWPTQLDDLHQAPPLQERGGVPVGLWVKGPLRLDRLGASVAVVGSRGATTYGEAVAGEIAGVCAVSGVPVVSGGAFGIDAAAHHAALAVGGATLAVLACGADRVYPTAHRELIDQIAQTGAVVSEGPLGCAPLRIRFLARNRLIAALTRGTVVVEAATRSGALNSANWALRLNRVVMGVPGPVTSVSSAGVHEQLRIGAMTLVTAGAEVLELVGVAGDHLFEPDRAPVTARDRLTPRQRQVLDAVPAAVRAGPESIARVSGMGVLEVRAALEKLKRARLVDRGDLGWRLTVEAH